MRFRILLVEDSLGDVRLTQEAFLSASKLIDFHFASDGEEAMAFLRQTGEFVNALRPDLILLDLYLPGMDGRQVLAEIKSNESLKAIPTVILTSSNAEVDVVESYQLKANCYLSKPSILDDFDGLIKSISDFWLIRAKLPARRRTV